MHPTFLEHPHIGSYSVMLLLAFAAAWGLGRWRARSLGVEGRHLDNLVLFIMVIAPMGARLFNRLFYHQPPLSLLEALRIWEGGGLVFYGGLLFGAGTVITYALAKRIPLGRMGDLLAPSIAIGLCLGRVGCFLAGCCWGDICQPTANLASLSPEWQQRIETTQAPQFLQKLAVTFPQTAGAWRQHRALGLIEPGAPRSAPVHPTQLYEALIALALALFLHFGFRPAGAEAGWRSAWFRARADGEVFCAFGIGYGTLRFLMEFLRADSAAKYAGMTISQTISLLIIAACGAWWLVLRKRAASTVVVAMPAVS